MSVWLEDDPVHLTASAFKDIASLVQNQAELAVQGRPVQSRRSIDSIVTGQQLVPAPALLQVPGWISATESHKESGGFGRGFRRGQRWNRGRGRGNRTYPYWEEMAKSDSDSEPTTFFSSQENCFYIRSFESAIITYA